MRSGVSRSDSMGFRAHKSMIDVIREWMEDGLRAVLAVSFNIANVFNILPWHVIWKVFERKEEIFMIHIEKLFIWKISCIR